MIFLKYDVLVKNISLLRFFTETFREIVAKSWFFSFDVILGGDDVWIKFIVSFVFNDVATGLFSSSHGLWAVANTRWEAVIRRMVWTIILFSGDERHWYNWYWNNWCIELVCDVLWAVTNAWRITIIRWAKWSISFSNTSKSNSFFSNLNSCWHISPISISIFLWVPLMSSRLFSLFLWCLGSFDIMIDSKVWNSVLWSFSSCNVLWAVTNTWWETIIWWMGWNVILISWGKWLRRENTLTIVINKVALFLSSSNCLWAVANSWWETIIGGAWWSITHGSKSLRS